MIRTRSISLIAAAIMLVACNESQTTEPQAALRYDDVYPCCTKGPVLAPSTLSLGMTQIAAFIIPPGDIAKLPNGTQVSVSAPTGPSDTIPGPPVPPGALQSIYARFGFTPFRSANQAALSLGAPLPPSDTIPGPPAPGASFKQLSNGGVLVWLPVSQLQKNGLTTSSTLLNVTLTKGNQTLYSAVVDVAVTK